jgi:hypothetical protein
MNAAIFTKPAKGLILASGLIAASSVMGYAQDAPVALGAQATVPLSSLYASAPSGIVSLGGHTFDLSGGNLIPLANGQSASFTGSWPNATGAYLLLNTANTYWWYDQSVVGSVTVTFSDGTTQTTNLTVGGNIREWRIGAGFTVNTTTDPATSNVWSGSATVGSTAVIDMLSISLAGTKTVTGVSVSNTNSFGGLQIHLAGLTIDPVASKATCVRPGNSVNIAKACANSQAAAHAKSANFTGTSPSQGKSTNSADAGMTTPAMTTLHPAH